MELHALFPPNIIWVIKSRIKWVGSLWHVWGRGEVHTGLLGGKHEEKTQLGRRIRRLEENIKMSLQEIGWGEWARIIWLRVGTGGRLL